MRFGVDLGGTKTEIIALEDNGEELYRKRIPTVTTSYDSAVIMLRDLVLDAEKELGRVGTVGVGMPGTISAKTGLVKNANLQIMNGHALHKDLSHMLGREVRCVNDANCLAVSEATDGAGAGQRMVFAIILGTGCGAGLALDAKVWNGGNFISGEFGHNPLPWARESEVPGPKCWCGLHGCLELWISGTGFELDYQRSIPNMNDRIKGKDIMALYDKGDEIAVKTFKAYKSRVARAIAHVANLVDPDCFVLGGGMSNVSHLYDGLQADVQSYVFGNEFETPILKSKHGDSSGVRGAAWLWSAGESSDAAYPKEMKVEGVS